MKPAKPLIVDSFKRLRPSSVLDLGCGDCKFSKKFIDNGIKVIGIDKEKLAESSGSFKFIQRDILDYNFSENFDLVFAIGILHFFKKHDAERIIKKVQTQTINRGYNFFMCMSEKEKYADGVHFYTNKEVLNKLYLGWEIIHNTECLSKKHGEEGHKHKLIFFLARKK